MIVTESLARAVDLLIAGAWQEAHEIVQDQDSALAAWLGIVHTFEGDLDNARYWYRKAGRVFPGPDAVQEELVAGSRGYDHQAGERQDLYVGLTYLEPRQTCQGAFVFGSRKV